MQEKDDASAMAFAVLRNRGYRFLAVSRDGVVVSNGSPTLAIDVSRPVKPDAVPVRGSKRHYRRYGRAGYIAKQTNYKQILSGLESGQGYGFANLPGVPTRNLCMALTNAAHRILGKGAYSVETNSAGVTVNRK